MKTLLKATFGLILCLILFSAHHKDGFLSDKEQHCLEIFNKLKATKGLLPSQAPHFHLVQSLPKSKFVMAMAEGNDIYLDQQTYDLCINQMPDQSDEGLAFILGHEIAHFTHKHEGRHHYIEKAKINTMMDLSEKSMVLKDSTDRKAKARLKSKLKQIDQKFETRKNEAEADLEGGFMSYLAGYKSKSAAINFLAKAYEKFNIQKEGGNYVTLAERQEIIKEAYLNLDTLCHVFEAGNLAASIGEFNIALEAFDYVSQLFQSSEIYNNMGVTELLSLSYQLNAQDLPYALPLTLDIDAMKVARDIGQKGMDEFEKLQKLNHENDLKKISKAISYFDKASTVNPEYHFADLNKSIAILLKSLVNKHYNPDSEISEEDLIESKAAAISSRKKIKEHDDKNSSARANANIQLAIINHIDGNSKKTKKYLKQAKKVDPNNYLIGLNESVFDGNKNTLMDTLLSQDKINNCDTKELIYGKLPIHVITSKHKNKWQGIKTISNPSSAQDTFRINTTIKYSDSTDYRIYQIEQTKEEGVVIYKSNYVLTKDNYDKSTSCDISIGDSRNDLLNKYGTAVSSIISSSGSMENYWDPSRIMTDDNKEGLVFKISDSTISSLVFYKVTK